MYLTQGKKEKGEGNCFSIPRLRSTGGAGGKGGRRGWLIGGVEEGQKPSFLPTCWGGKKEGRRDARGKRKRRFCKLFAEKRGGGGRKLLVRRSAVCNKKGRENPTPSFEGEKQRKKN